MAAPRLKIHLVKSLPLRWAMRPPYRCRLPFPGDDHGVLILDDGSVHQMGDSREAMFPSILGYSIQSVSYNGGLLGLLMRTVRFGFLASPASTLKPRG